MQKLTVLLTQLQVDNQEKFAFRSGSCKCTFCHSFGLSIKRRHPPSAGTFSVGHKVRKALPVCELLWHAPPCWLSLPADLLICLHSVCHYLQQSQSRIIQTSHLLTKLQDVLVVERCDGQASLRYSKDFRQWAGAHMALPGRLLLLQAAPVRLHVAQPLSWRCSCPANHPPTQVRYTL